jgi:catechol 2,3-dioxygenase-like lactoylglutathione lyase family enzyme
MTAGFSHLGICVADLDRSLRFYCEGLGFDEVAAHEVGPEFGELMELDDLQLSSRMIRNNGVTVELLGYGSPAVEGEPVRRPMNRLGLTHLSFRVGDLEAVAARIEEYGGQVLATTRTTLDFGDTTLDFVYCTDPDGVRLELMDRGAERWARRRSPGTRRRAPTAARVRPHRARAPRVPPLP